MEKEWTVYKHTAPNGKVYIGITSQKVEDRWKNGLGYGNNKHFTRAIKKYGWNNIKHEILYTDLTKKEAEQMEIKLIAQHKSNDPNFGYNESNGGEAKGKHTERSKKKMSINVKKSFEDGRRQKFLSEFQKERLKDKANHPMFGKHHSEETKEKLRKILKGLLTGGDNPNSKKVICSNMIFDCVKDCAEYYGENYNTMRCWLNGDRRMPKKYFDLGLRYIDKEMSDYEVQLEYFTYGNNSNSKKVFCDNVIFSCIKECSECYKKHPQTIGRWLNGKEEIPKLFQTLGLRYATEKDILTYPKYDKEKYNNENIVPYKKTKKAIYYNGLIFLSIRQYSKYCRKSRETIRCWLNDTCKMPKEFQDLGLRYATEEDLLEYPIYNENIK